MGTKKEEYIDKMAEQLKEWSAKIDELESKVTGTTADVKAGYENRIRELKDVEKQPPLPHEPMDVGTDVGSVRRGAVMIVTPRDRFDTNSAPEVERILLGHIQRGERKIVLDLSNISYISSIGLRVILKAVMVMTGAGGRLVLSGGNEQVRTVLQLSGALMMRLHASTLEEAHSKVQVAG